MQKQRGSKMVNKPKGDVLMTASELETKKVAPLFFF